MQLPTYTNEIKKIREGFAVIAGCDEAGRGPLAGPVVAACVVLDPRDFLRSRRSGQWWGRVRDSKTVGESEREQLAVLIKQHSLDFGIGIVSEKIIDRINIHQASLLAMKKSVQALTTFPDYLFLDGVHAIKNFSVPQETCISGDSKIISIAAASILAKVARDQIMLRLDKIFPQYGFRQHKGYATRLHQDAIRRFGLISAHRRSFANSAQKM